MSDFQQVSLGFAEFVGQLLTETFEASLNAQQYQLKRFSDIRAALELSDAEFLSRFVDDQAVLDKEVDIAGAPLMRQMEIPDTHQDYILELAEEFEDHSIIYQNRLTNYGFESLKQVVIELVAQQQREQLKLLLMQMEQSKLAVDSGEIRAKLELGSLVDSEQLESADGAGLVGNQSQGLTKSKQAPSKMTAGSGSSQLDPSKIDIVDTPIEQIEMPKLTADYFDKYIDPDTNETTVLLDTKKLSKLDISKSSPLRLKAKTLSSSSNTQLYSEVKINFKVV